ncbi:hypothetical protein SARC_14603 [Sphaeroforma arctica JP610]|uniref:Uncharacterized protein n=1 Tax=Sphaeroforma arctica JP610 TaxID=667725 RepID=A0A0L0F7X8_9EUKA|nr:hypothetical protein SARC_14603 [Sphaeroforma arctica JP610]KNC72837.1 hypothetical protein SARC_14603 [Sphaeroforma arctica JP610]|eukprot:XP_014146739.1 hypothetical protein SARC_14603 [Sphaeroforma arctica JP610]
MVLLQIAVVAGESICYSSEPTCINNNCQDITPNSNQCLAEWFVDPFCLAIALNTNFESDECAPLNLPVIGNLFYMVTGGPVLNSTANAVPTDMAEPTNMLSPNNAAEVANESLSSMEAETHTIVVTVTEGAEMVVFENSGAIVSARFCAWSLFLVHLLYHVM